ncbi:right-handed parallel beta-helix repeat-containing protein, partial [Bacteroidota bacterium]
MSVLRMYWRSICFLIVSISAFPAANNAEDLNYYISPAGNDAWAGNINKPFASIQKARDVIREVNKGGNSVTVYLREGIYQLSGPIIFNPEDSGNESAPITYTAYAGENPVIMGGKLDKGLSLSQLLIFEGKDEIGEYVEYINICGITFSGTASPVKKDPSGKDIITPEISLINLRNAHQCIFKDNIISNFNAPAFQMSGYENKIIGNEIFNAVGGAICVKGANFTIENNYIHDIQSAGRATPGWGICLDTATKNATIENNIVVRTGVCLYIRENNKDISIVNNVFAFGDLSLVKLSNPKDQSHKNIRLSRNIFYYKKSDVDIFNISGDRSVPEISDYNIFWNPGGCIWLNPVI